MKWFEEKAVEKEGKSTLQIIWDKGSHVKLHE